MGRAHRDVRSPKGFSVEIVDAEADELTPEQAADASSHSNPRLVAVVVYGHQPSASTQNMTGASGIVTALKNARIQTSRS